MYIVVNKTKYKQVVASIFGSCIYSKSILVTRTITFLLVYNYNNFLVAESHAESF